jgi:capsule polysaccharide export protein KpsE/RkpR
MSKEVAAGNTRGVAALQAQLDTLAKYGGAYVSIRDALEHEKKQLVALKLKYEEAKIDAEEFLPHKFIVDRAYKAEKKSYPVRWLIVVVTTLSTFLLALFGLIIFENIRKFISIREL